MSIFGWSIDPNFLWVLTGTMILGMTSGMIGCFAVLKKQSLISDAVAHAALPGVCLAFIIVQNKDLLALVVGAAIVGYIATWTIQLIVKQSKIAEDTSIALVLSVFFGLGIVLLTYISSNLGGNQSGLNDFIFGSAAAMTLSDIRTISIFSVVLLIALFLFYKEFKLITFDRNFAQSIGLSYSKWNNLLMIIIVGAIVIGIQTVGVVLMTAMIIIPPVAARYWTNRLFVMILLAGFFGALSSVLGTYLSSVALRVPTGPVIVLCQTAIFLISMAIGPKGLLYRRYMWKRLQKQYSNVRQKGGAR